MKEITDEDTLMIHKRPIETKKEKFSSEIKVEQEKALRTRDVKKGSNRMRVFELENQLREKKQIMNLENKKRRRVEAAKNIKLNKKKKKKVVRMVEKPVILLTRNIEKVWETYTNNGWIDGMPHPLGPFDGIKNAWKNKPCFIIGSGPDLKVFIENIGWDFFNGKHTIGINHVIESYSNFEWFFFLDRRFLKRTTYNLEEFHGKIFAQNNTGVSNKFKNVVRFRCRGGAPSENIEKGLYSNRFSGLSALNLAIISGANPIYLLGFGMGKEGNPKQFHFRTKYQGVGTQPTAQFGKYLKVYKMFDKFKKWSSKIIHVTGGKALSNFKKMTFGILRDKFNIVKKSVNINLKVEPKIVHLSFSEDIKRHADITRHIITDCIGKHSIQTFKDIPPADLYITEHFMSTNKSVQQFPYKNKTINIVHSMHCFPNGNFLCNVALTKIWERMLARRNVKNIKYISGGIDLDPYKNIEPEMDKKIFGRITRWSPGKIPPWWNRVVQEILDSDKDIKCLFFIDMASRARELLNHKRMIYDYSCNITDFKGAWLKKLGIYVHANGTFRETMSHAVIEAMATGLPIVFIREPAVTEVTGPAGIGVGNPMELKEAIIQLLNNKDLRESYGALSKQRAKLFDIKIMVEKWNQLIKECI